MPFLAPPDKPPSRFPTLKVFKLKPDTAPPPPPKDTVYDLSPNSSLNPPSAFYTRSLFSRSAASLAPSLSPDSISGPATPATPYPPIPSISLDFARRSNVALASANARSAAGSPVPSASGGSLKSLVRIGGDLFSPSMDGSTDSSGSCPNAPTMYLSNGANASSCTMSQPTSGTKPKKSVFKLANLVKRNRSKKDLSDVASTSGTVSRSTSVSEQEGPSANPEGDEGISAPWNFQHNIHVDEGYIGLPPSWSSALSQAGFDEDEIAAIHARRRAAATSNVLNANQANSHATASNEWAHSPHTSSVALPTTSVSSSPVLLEPAPRSTSLRKGRDALTVHPPSMYSTPTSTSGSTIGGISPAPSPRAPSFSMKSLVSGIKSSLTSDLASMKDGIASSSAVGEESDQYVLVNGDVPGEGPDQGAGDETFIESYSYDTASVSSHQTHASRIRQMSQGQETPVIQVQRAQSDAGHASVHSSASHVPSPLAHSTSLPTPTPPRGDIYSNRSASPSPSHFLGSAGPLRGPAPAPSWTPPRRVYHVANPSSGSYDETTYAEPPPAYVSPKMGEWVPKEKESFGDSGGAPPPNKTIPPIPAEESVGDSSGLSNHGEDREASITDTTSSSVNNISGTVDEILDITSYYGDNADHEGDAEVDPAQRTISPTPPLVIDKRVTKLAVLPPRISFHQEGSLEDWSEALFSAIGDKEKKRSSILMGNDAMSLKKKRRSTLRPISPLSMTVEENTATTASGSTLPEEAVAPPLPDISFGGNLTLGAHVRGTGDAVEGDAQEHEEEGISEDGAEQQADNTDTTTTAEEKVKEAGGSPATPLTPVLPDVSLSLNVSSIGKDLESPPSTPPSSSESLRKASIESIPPSPPPKPKLKPAPLAMPLAATLVPPRTNVITGISGRSPVNSLFGTKPQPLPIPIPPSQIRAQLRPAPPKPPHPPPTLPLPPLKRFSSQPSSPAAPVQSRPPIPPIPSPQMSLRHDFAASRSLPSDSRPNSSQTLGPIRVNPDRDSGLSTITVTPATIATAKAEVVRTAVASVIDSDAVSLASKRESAVSTADTGQEAVTHNKAVGDGESLRTQEFEGAPDNSLISETSSVSLLRDSPQSKWPTPPPPPVELETDSTPRRVSRFRTTSLGRVSQLHAMNGAATSPCGSHSSHGSSDTMSSSTSESAPLTTPKGVNGVPSVPSKTKGSLAPEARLINSMTDTFGGVDVEIENREEGEARSHLSEMPLSEPRASMATAHPLLAYLQPHISSRDPTSCFTNLVEVAEGESGSVFAARVASSPAYASSREGSAERPIPPGTSHVAIKRISLPPIAISPSLSDDSPLSNKLVSVLHELVVLKGLEHEHLLLLDALYVSNSEESARAVDTSLWIRMELMERSLADVIGLAAEGLALQERLIARFASDILHGLDYLQRKQVAHRDVRSDNLLVNASGVVKLADFSNAIRVDRNAPTVSGAVGVIYWQAPEMRAGPYNALKVDIWSLGATVWELAETVPPFSTPASPSTQISFAIQTARHLGSQWPPLSHPEHYSRTFHEFLKLCGKESGVRPCPGELLNTSFIRNACGRAVILQLLSQCRAIEEAIAAKEASASSS